MFDVLVELSMCLQRVIILSVEIKILSGRKPVRLVFEVIH